MRTVGSKVLNTVTASKDSTELELAHAVTRRTPKQDFCIMISDYLRPSSVPSQALLLSDALGFELLQHVVQVARVGVAVTREVGAKLGLVVHLVPDHRVGLAGGAGRADGEDEVTVPRHQQQPQNLASLFAVREVAVSWKAAC